MNRKIRISVAVLTIVGVCFCSVLTWAADDTQAVEAPNAAASAEGSVKAESTQGPLDLDDLARRSTDPTASPMTFSFVGTITTDYYDLADGSSIDGTGGDLAFRPVLPFKAWGASHILRMTLPYQVSGAGPNGLGSISIFDLMVFKKSWGRLGAGLVASFSSKSDAGSSHAAIGPAIGFMKPISKKLQFGLFNQNLFSGDTEVSQLQPILAYQLGDGWSLSLGDLQIAYDWKNGDFVSIPFGVQLGKVLPVWGQPMRFAVNPQFNFKDTPGVNKFSILLTVSLLIPGG